LDTRSSEEQKTGRDGNMVSDLISTIGVHRWFT
jgi:hypothetical protein